jgi:hypothetical protein
VLYRNFEFVISYFELSKKDKIPPKPRVCLKLKNGNYLKTILRDRASEFPVDDFPINLNTAFKRIDRGASYYHCSDIPKDAKTGEYINARLIDEKVQEFGSDSRVKWRDCWTGFKDAGSPDMYPPEETCYKSTLVIPLSFSNKGLKKDFIDFFSSQKSNGSEKLVFGFLCLDHQCVDFFDLVLDEKFAYIIADILSLYLTAHNTYIDSSHTFKAVSLWLIDTKK